MLQDVMKVLAPRRAHKIVEQGKAVRESAYM